jgi:hypothetical protein
MLPIKRHNFKLVPALYFYHIFDNIRKGYDNLKPDEENHDYSYPPIYLVLFENQKDYLRSKAKPDLPLKS